MKSMGKMIGQETGKLVRQVLAPLVKKKKARRKKVANTEIVVSSSRQAAPVAIDYKIRKTRPLISQSGEVTTVRHFELVDAIITTTSTFSSAVNVNIQPGDYNTFPWLSQMAKLFKKYKFSKLRFIYVPFCSTATAGTIEMAVDFDSANPATALEQDFANFTSYAAGTAWQKSICTIDCGEMNRDHRWRLVRPLAYAGQVSQLANYDCGKFYLYTNNGGSVNCGKLYVEYTIDFTEPVLPPVGVVIGASFKSISGSSNSKPFGTGGIANAVGNNGVYVDNITSAPSSSVLSFAGPGTYTFEYISNGVALSDVTWSSVPGYTLPNVVTLTSIVTSTQILTSGYIQVLDDQSAVSPSNVGTSSSAAFMNCNLTGNLPWC